MEDKEDDEGVMRRSGVVRRSAVMRRIMKMRIMRRGVMMRRRVKKMGMRSDEDDVYHNDEGDDVVGFLLL